MTEDDVLLLRAELHKFLTNHIQQYLEDGEIVTNWILVYEARGEEYSIGSISSDILGERPLPVWTFSGMLEEAVEIKHLVYDDEEEE